MAGRSGLAPPGNAVNYGANVKIRGLSKDYAGLPAINDINLDIEAGEFVTLLGPSGSGKTTTMMVIAGFIENYSGEIQVGGKVIDHLPAHRRDIGVVFQHLALFPHMSALENVAFPLRMRGLPDGEVKRRVHGVIELVKMTGLESRLPSELSGGQQQRVALARAIVFSPPLLLLDEPLGSLDRKLRESMQLELKTLHTRLGLTVIHVTHDQGEAMAISDRIAVINGGRIEQYGTPNELYSRPANKFVAEFVGESAFIEGVVGEVSGPKCAITTRGGRLCLAAADPSLAPGARVTLMVRPERFILGADAMQTGNRFIGDIRNVTFTGDRIRYEIALSSVEVVVATVPNSGAVPMSRGQHVDVGWKPEDATLFLAG